eukprot:jgi/Galph1/3235/GphlegSOOS_G1913.1
MQQLWRPYGWYSLQAWISLIWDIITSRIVKLAQVPQVSLSGKVAIVTGANSGIGKETARYFFESGATIILACRNMKSGEQVIEELCDSDIQSTKRLVVLELDLSSTNSVRSFVRKFESLQVPLHYLILNAGVMGGPLAFTQDGVELHFGVNHLGHFMLTMLLMDKISETSGVRIVVVSSLTYLLGSLQLDDINYRKRSYRRFEAYATSKLCNLLFMRELCKRCLSWKLKIASVHPGDVHTNVARNFGHIISLLYHKIASLFLRSPKEGAATVFNAAVDPFLTQFSGIFVMNVNRVVPLVENALDESDAKALWSKSLQMIPWQPKELDMLKRLQLIDNEEERLLCSC